MPFFMSGIMPALVRMRAHLVLTLHTCRLTTGLLICGLVYPVALESVLNDEACFDQSTVYGPSGEVRLAPTSPWNVANLLTSICFFALLSSLPTGGNLMFSGHSGIDSQWFVNLLSELYPCIMKGVTPLVRAWTTV